VNPAPENVEGQLIRSHSFNHSVQHRINWSHVLVAVIVFAIIWRVGPAVVEAAR